MRITTLSVWFNNAVHQASQHGKRLGHALSRRMRNLGIGVDRGVGVGDDESSFGGRGSRVWLELIEEAQKRLLELFEKSVFERFPRFQKAMRKWLGGESLKKQAPALRPAHPKVTGPLGAQQPNPQAARMQQQIRNRIHRAHTEEHAGLRHQREAERDDSAD